MAQRRLNPHEPSGVGGKRHADNPEVPVGVTGNDFTKRGSYSSPEEEVPVSPAKEMTRQWATSSYDPHTGRAARVGDDPYPGHGHRHDRDESHKQVPSAGNYTKSRHTVPPTKPGRW